MAPLTLEAVYRALKRGEISPVYYLTGDQEILKDELARAIVDTAVDPAARDFNVDTRSAGDVAGETLHALIETPPMLTERRAVVLRGLEQWRSNAAVWRVLTRYLAQPSPTTALILIHGAGEKPRADVASAAQHVQVDALSPDRVRRWATARAQRVGLDLESEATDHLIAAVGADLAQLAMEIEKLAAAAIEGRPMTLAEVGRLVGVRRGETLVDWVDAVLRHDVVTATGLLEVVLPQPGVTGVRLVMALGTALVGTRLARAVLDGGAGTRQAEETVFRHIREARPPGLGVWREEARRWTAAARRWTGTALDRAIRGAYDADRALKASRVSDERGVITSLLLALSPGQVAA